MKPLSLPLHLAQNEVYFDQITDLQSPHCNVGGYLVITQELDEDKFIEALKSYAQAFDIFSMKIEAKESASLSFSICC